MTEKRIGKIKSVRFGHGGYQDACIGFSFDLGSDKEGWGVGDFWGTWAMQRTEGCKWTDKSRIELLGKEVMRMNELLSQANVTSLEKLLGIPVEVTFEGNTLKGWRILTEVI